MATSPSTGPRERSIAASSSALCEVHGQGRFTDYLPHQEPSRVRRYRGGDERSREIPARAVEDAPIASGVQALHRRGIAAADVDLVGHGKVALVTPALNGCEKCSVR